MSRRILLVGLVWLVWLVGWGRRFVGFERGVEFEFVGFVGCERMWRTNKRARTQKMALTG